MAHELSEVSGKAEMFWSGGKPWHGLGTQFPELLTAGQVHSMPEINWKVEQAGVLFDAGDGQRVIPDRMANIRRRPDGTPVYLGTVSMNYQVFQNQEFVDFMDELAAQGQAKFETGGAIRDGKRVWFSLKLPGEIDLGKGDRTEKYLLGINDHSGKMKARVFFTPIRVVCANTMRAAIGGTHEEAGIGIRHQGNLAARIEEAKHVLGFAVDYFQEMEKRFEAFVRKSLSKDETIQYIAKCVNLRGNTEREVMKVAVEMKSILGLTETGRGADLHPGTLWNAMNAVVEHVDHEAYEGRKKFNAQGRFESLVYGPGQEIKQRAFNNAVALI